MFNDIDNAVGRVEKEHIDRKYEAKGINAAGGYNPDAFSSVEM